MSKDYGDILEKYDSQYDDLVVEQRRSYLPEGIYQAVITEARVEESDWGNLQLMFTFEAVTGPSKGGTVKRFYSLEDERGQGYLKQDMATLNFDLPKLSALPQLTTMLIGTFAEIKVQRKEVVKEDGKTKTYTNVYINKLIETDPYYPDVQNSQYDDAPF